MGSLPGPILFLHFSAFFTSTCGELCLFSLCQPDLHGLGFQILGFLTYLGDRLCGLPHEMMQLQAGI